MKTTTTVGSARTWTRRRAPRTVAILGCALTGLCSGYALADEGGVSFWLPGQFASFAAVPGSPGWSIGAVYYHTDLSASASKDFIIGGNLAGGIDARADLVFLAPSYTFKDPVLGGQAAVSLVAAFGTMDVAANLLLTGPGGGQGALRRDDSTTGGSDLYPLATLKWASGTNNTLAYLMGGIPVGDYQQGRLANIGINHYSIDGGGGYTYLDPAKGHEISVTGGLTYNFENNDTHYKNGIDSHLDWAISQFLSEKIHVGVAGYVYYQLSGDSGSGAKLGSFESRVYSAGPEVGYFFPFNQTKGYVQFKTYFEWGAQNRPSGWNLWLSALLPLGG